MNESKEERLMDIIDALSDDLRRTSSGLELLMEKVRNEMRIHTSAVISELQEIKRQLTRRVGI